MKHQGLDERIRQRAYQIWKSEGEPQGRERIHWIRAEAEFREMIICGGTGIRLLVALRSAGP